MILSITNNQLKSKEPTTTCTQRAMNKINNQSSNTKIIINIQLTNQIPIIESSQISKNTMKILFKILKTKLQGETKGG